MSMQIAPAQLHSPEVYIIIKSFIYIYGATIKNQFYIVQWGRRRIVSM